MGPSSSLKASSSATISPVNDSASLKLDLDCTPRISKGGLSPMLPVEAAC